MKVLWIKIELGCADGDLTKTCCSAFLVLYILVLIAVFCVSASVVCF